MSLPSDELLCEELAIAWGEEWANLSDAHKAVIVADVQYKMTEEGWAKAGACATVKDHRNDIFSAPLHVYADTVARYYS